LTIRAAVTGPTRAALALVRQARPDLALGFDASAVGGDVAANVRLEVPVRGRMRAEDVRVAVSANARHLAVPNLFRGWSFSDGDVQVKCPGRSVRVTGDGRVAGVPVTFDFEANSADGVANRRLDASAHVGSAERAALGFDLRPYVDGPVDVKARLADGAKRGTLHLTADLSAATVTAPALAVVKPPGAPGGAEARIALVRGVATAIERFAVSAGGASVTGRAGLSAGGSQLESLDTKATIAARDAAHPAGHFALAVHPDHGTHAFVLTSDDAGALFRAFDAGADATGGRLRYAGRVDVGTAGMPLDGRLEVHDFTLLRSPLLARVTTLASLSGITNLFQNRGVRFDRLDARIANRGSTVTIADAVATGRSVDVVVSGTIDRGDWTTSLHGTLTPSYYGLNAAPGRVPFVGKLITGQGGSLQAFEFEVNGPLVAPRVSVDPLRSVAPGALRDVARRPTAIRR